MKILALDSSGLVASVALLENDNLVAEFTVNTDKMPAAYDSKAGKLVAADGATADELSAYIKSISKVKVDDKEYAASGRGAKVIVKEDGSVEFEKRVKRPPDNLINTLISFMNTIIYTKTLSEIYKTQLNPTISYLHEPSDKRFSLCLDISEVFKPLIVDRTIFSLLNKNMINEDNFYKDDDGYYRMKESTTKIIIKALENTLTRSIKHKDLNRNVSYKHLIRLELYKLIKHLIDEKVYDGFKIWW